MRFIRRTIRIAAIALVTAAPSLPPALAQQPAPVQQPTPAQAPAAQQPPARTQPLGGGSSDAEVVLMLIRLTLAAVHQANVTGNYTVLRDIAAPSFREKNSAADLARIFAGIREAKIDLGPAVLLDPRLTRAALNEQNMLHLAGSLETKPVPVMFELLLQPIEGVWRVFGIAISPVQPGAQSTAPSAPKQPAKQPAAVRGNREPIKPAAR